MTDRIQSFILQGAHLNRSIEDIREKLLKVKAYVFDWDGVFNNGIKYGDQGSPFAEADSMGTNLVRLGHWLRNDETMPLAGIITGAVNKGVEYFVTRECMDLCLRGFNNKAEAWDILLREYSLKPEEVAFVFDDVIDLSIASKCGVRFCVRRDASPAFRQHVIDHDLCDYITAAEGGQGAVREVCEFILSMHDQYDRVVETRVAYDETYRRYLAARKLIQTNHMFAG